MDLNAQLSPVPPESKFHDEDDYVWGGSVVAGPEGKYHMFYSRWPRSTGFKGWLTHSEIAHAVSDEPGGPYRHVDVALPARGAAKWDGLCTHNPTIDFFDGQYHLYYTGNTGDGKNTKDYNWTHRNNQRIGVAVADHPRGPWTRSDQPLIDASPDEDAHDALMTTNPSVCRRPDGTYLMVYKCAGKKKNPPAYGPVTHMVAVSDSPTGPFQKLPDPVFTAQGDSFPAEDPYIWVQDGRFFAIVKDMRGSFTGKRHSMAVFESNDGVKWQLATNPLLTTAQVNWHNGGIETVERLERPQLLLKDGVPAILFCAVKKGNDTFNVHIPLAKR